MQAIILAAGKGERLRPLTLKTPKPLLRVHDKALIEYHIEELVKTGVKHIVINVSWLADQIIEALGNGERWGITITYSHEGEEPLETGGGILKALKNFKSNSKFVVVNGDVKTDFDFGKLSKLNDKLAHLILISNPKHHPDGDFSIAKDKSLSPDGGEKFTFSGIGIYSTKLFEDCQPGKFKLAPLLRQLMKKKLVTGELYTGQWTDVGTIERYKQINK